MDNFSLFIQILLLNEVILKNNNQEQLEQIKIDYIRTINQLLSEQVETSIKPLRLDKVQEIVARFGFETEVFNINDTHFTTMTLEEFIQKNDIKTDIIFSEFIYKWTNNGYTIKFKENPETRNRKLSGKTEFGYSGRIIE